MIVDYSIYQNFFASSAYSVFLSNTYADRLAVEHQFSMYANKEMQTLFINRETSAFMNNLGQYTIDFKLIRPFPKSQEKSTGLECTLMSVQNDQRFPNMLWLIQETDKEVPIPQLYYTIRVLKVLPYNNRREVNRTKKYEGVYQKENGKFISDVIPDYEYDTAVDAAIVRNKMIDMERNSSGYHQRRRKNKIDNNDVDNAKFLSIPHELL